MTGIPWGPIFIFGAMALAVGLAVWGQRSGKNKERLDDAEDELAAVAVSKEVRQGVDRLNDGAAFDELRKRRGLLPSGKPDRR